MDFKCVGHNHVLIYSSYNQPATALAAFQNKCAFIKCVVHTATVNSLMGPSLQPYGQQCGGVVYIYIYHIKNI